MRSSRRRSAPSPASRCRSPSRRSRRPRCVAGEPVEAASREGAAIRRGDRLRRRSAGQLVATQDEVAVEERRGDEPGPRRRRTARRNRPGRPRRARSSSSGSPPASPPTRPSRSAGSSSTPAPTSSRCSPPAATRFVGDGDVLRARLRAGAHGAVRPARPDPAHPPRPGGRPRPRRAGDGELPRRVRRRDRATTCSARPCSPRRLRSSSARRCTPRCGSTPRSRRTSRPWSGAGVDVVEPESGRLAGGDEGPGRLADPAVIVAAAAAVLAGRGAELAGVRVLVTRRGHAGADRPRPLSRQPLLGTPGLRDRRGGPSARRHGDPRLGLGARPAGRRRVRAGRDRGRARPGRSRPRRPRPTSS